jgi:hypothetical protein
VSPELSEAIYSVSLPSEAAYRFRNKQRSV